MNICEDNHAQICYEGRVCPLCELRELKDKRINELVESVDELKESLASSLGIPADMIQEDAHLGFGVVVKGKAPAE